jgi:hypothetical protein
MGCADDDYIGCDSNRAMGYCYNAEDADCSGTFRYNGITPAVGLKFLNASTPSTKKMTSFGYYFNNRSAPVCEWDPCPDIPGAYNYIRGYKRDKTHYVIPPGGQQNVTKYCFSGDPETGIGWTEGMNGNPHGLIQNCGGPNVYTGNLLNLNYGTDGQFVMSSGADNYQFHPNDTNKIYFVQLIAQGTNRLNSVTKLKQLADLAQTFYEGGFIIGEHNISSTVPNSFSLYQNYPNPFNPTTGIKYEVSKSDFLILTVYDVLGKVVATLVNEKQQPGSYRVEWDGFNYPGGVYFYRLRLGNFEQTRKMVLVK